MSEFLALAISGAVAGGIYALFASGLVLTYETSGVFNFAHAAVAYVSALAFYVLRAPEGAGIPAWVAAAVVLALAPALGWLLDRVMLRALANAPQNARIIGTVGLLVALPALTRVVYGMATAAGARLPELAAIAAPGLGPSPATVWNPLAGVAIDSDQVAVFIAAALAAVALWWLLRRTRFGLLTRASVDRRDLARLRGVDVERISSVTWMAGFFLAGLTGLLIAPLFQLAPGIFDLLMVGSFAAVVFARFRSLPLAFAGGLAVGLVQNLAFAYAPSFVRATTGLQSAIPFLLLFAVVVWRGPSASGEAGDRVSERAPAMLRGSRRRTWAGWLIAALALAATLSVATDYWSGLIAKGLTFGIVFVSIVFVTGIGGMVSLAQAAFATIGGLAVGLLTVTQFDRTMPVLMHNGRFAFGVALVIGVAVAVVAGVLMAVPSLRVSGLALAISTLALALLAEQLGFRQRVLNNGTRGWVVPAPSFGPVDLAQPRVMAAVAFLVCAGLAAAVAGLRSTRFGMQIMAVRASDDAAQSIGIVPLRVRVVVFAAAAGIAAIGGALLAPQVGRFSSETTPALLGVVWVAVVASFGLRRPGAAVAAGVVYACFGPALASAAELLAHAGLPTVVHATLASPHLPDVIFGLGAIGFAREPEGFVHAINARRARRARRARPGPTPLPVQAPSGALAISSLSVAYGAVVAVRSFDLTVADCESVALVGPNGAGKTSVVRAVSGLVTPRHGGIAVNGHDLAGVPTWRRVSAGLFVVPESGAVFPDLTVDENIAVAVPDRDRRASIYQRFPLLAARKHVRAAVLSGGEQRMVALAPALANGAMVLVADEPMLGLAPVATQGVIEELQAFRAAGGALLLAAERPELVVPVVDRIETMVSGAVTPSASANDDVHP